MSYVTNESRGIKAQIRNLKKIQSITLMGLFIAIYVVLYLFNIKFSATIQIRFGFFSIAAASMYGGPIFGAIVGILGDFLSMFVTGGQGASYFPGFTISYALMGILFGFAFYKVKITKLRALAGTIIEMLVSILNTYWLTFFGYPFIPTLISRVPKMIIMFVITYFLFYYGMNTLSKETKNIGR